MPADLISTVSAYLAPVTLDFSGGEPRVDSRLIAEQLGVEPINTRELIEQYQTDFEEFGSLPRFETEAVKVEGARGTKYVKFVLLNEDQSYLLLTYVQNTPQARDLKKRLVRTFGNYRRVLMGGSNESTALVPILSQGERYRSAVLSPETAHALQHVVKALPFNPQHKKTYFVDCQVILQVVVDDIMHWRWPCPYAYSFDSSGIAYLLICGKHLLWYLREAPHLAPFFPSPPGFDANKILRDLQLAGLLRTIKKDRPLLDGFRLNTQINIRALQDKEYRWGPSVTLPRRHR